MTTLRIFALQGVNTVYEHTFKNEQTAWNTLKALVKISPEREYEIENLSKLNDAYSRSEHSYLSYNNDGEPEYETKH